MSEVRVPVIAGLTHGVGTTTLAAALHGHDGGRYAGGPVDVLVCHSASLDRAATVPGVPVLVVVTADTEVVRARLRRIESRFGTVVPLPHAACLREVGNPFAEAAALLALAPDQRPPALRPYIDGLLAIVGALLRNGGLLRPGDAFRSGDADGAPRLRGATPVRRVPPAAVAVERPIWRGLGPVERTPVRLRTAATPPQPVRPTARPVPLRPLPLRPLPLRPLPLRPLPLRPLPGPPSGPAPSVVTAMPTSCVPSRPDPATLDDDALEAEPYLLPHLRTG